MHYNTIRDAAYGTALAILTGFWRPYNAIEALLCYITIFMVLASLMETARGWERRTKERRRKHDLQRKITGGTS